ncbi:hypothetical protein RGE_40910 [Rubrivivax gelatinosus IL144]|uniref:Uncharacterized protein n=1 Tax=Rubrivivax gelatinosus (strain NBRC 100245 / IL144) TaxID=983917 RepID=I0HWP0_RUBGI|nr:hypothetical protein RGE_40910 [Rubrivivax gelatinosus IL144]
MRGTRCLVRCRRNAEEPTGAKCPGLRSNRAEKIQRRISGAALARAFRRRLPAPATFRRSACGAATPSRRPRRRLAGASGRGRGGSS